MFSAVSNLGAGGTQNLTLSDTANGVLYGMFALTGLVSGGIANSTFFRRLVLSVGNPVRSGASRDALLHATPGDVRPVGYSPCGPCQFHGKA